MVRATFSGFNTALSALQANQKRLDITGQNLSNMNTAGYTRQQLEASSLNYTNPVSHYSNGNETAVGFGVSMDRVSQIRDPYLDIQYHAAGGGFSHGGTTPGSGRRRFRKDARPDTPDCVFNRGKTGGAVEYHGDHIYQ